MRRYPLAPLRRLRDEGARAAERAVAGRLRDLAAAQEAQRQEESRVQEIERQLSRGFPPDGLRGRDLATAALCRERQHRAREDARSAAAAAARQVEVAHGLLGAARGERERAVRASEAVASHHGAWTRERLRARDALDESQAEELASARWWAAAARPL